MLRSKKRLSFLLTLFLAAFLGMVLYLCYFELVEAPRLRDHAYNMRNWVDESKVARGLFLDRNGHEIISREQAEDGTYTRYSNHPYMYSSIIGYNSAVYGKSGLEAKYNSYLLNVQSENPIAWLKGQVLDAGIGNNVRLTIDNTLQYLAYAQLEGHKGAVVAMDPKTGQILAMVSLPSYNTNELDHQWNELIEREDSPLLNRASLGLYTPGSVMKMISGMAFLEYGTDLAFEDEGTLTVDGFTYSNVDEEPYGAISLREALIYSSNTYFAAKSIESGAVAMKTQAERFCLNQTIPFDLPVSQSSTSYAADMDKNELASSGFGQGKTLVSPLNMCMAYAAIANNGTLLAPSLVDAVVSPDGTEVYRPKAQTLSHQVGSSEHIAQMKSYLRDVAVETGSAAQIENYEIAGKTGTAQNVSDRTHAWYCGFAPAQNPQIVVCVVLEEEGESGGRAAAPVAGVLFDYWLNQRNN